MFDTIASHFIVFFIISNVYDVSATGRGYNISAPANYNVSLKSCFTMHYHVYLTNQIPNAAPVTHHCYSRDDDIGSRTLNFNGQFDLEFCWKFLPSTIFRCLITWNSHSLRFDVFNNMISRVLKSKRISWVMRTDGIFMVSDGQDLGMAYTWNGTRVANDRLCRKNLFGKQCINKL